MYNLQNENTANLPYKSHINNRSNYNHPGSSAPTSAATTCSDQQPALKHPGLSKHVFKHPSYPNKVVRYQDAKSIAYRRKNMMCDLKKQLEEYFVQFHRF